MFLIPHSGIPAPAGIPYDWSISTVYINTHINRLASCVQQSQNIASVSEAHDFCEVKFTEIEDKCLKDFPNIEALRFEQKMCLFDLSLGKDVFTMVPADFGKSMFQLFHKSTTQELVYYLIQ